MSSATFRNPAPGPAALEASRTVKWCNWAERRWLNSAAFVGMLIAFICISAQHAAAANYKAAAQFRVTNEVVNSDAAAFTATVPAIGNNLIGEGSGFEPIVYRNKYKALENSPDRVVVSAALLSHFDTLREGFLDGADVFVYRISNGRFSLVREDKVAERGFHVSGWWPAMPEDKLVPAGVTRYTFRWETWNRPGAKYYFTVRAVDRSGNFSAAAPVMAIERPQKVVNGATPAPFVEFRAVPSASDKTPPPAPATLRGTVTADGGLDLEWNAVNADDLAGYVVFRSDYPPERHLGYYMQLERRAASTSEEMKAGDMVFVSKKFYSTSRARQLSNRVWDAWQEANILLPGLVGFFQDEKQGNSWELVRHRAGTPVEDPGETYLKLELAAGATESIGIWNHSGTAQDFYEVLDKRPYTVEVWLRQEAGTGSVRFKFRGSYDQKFNGPGYSNPVQMIKPVEFAAGPEWKKYVATFMPPEILGGDVPNRMDLEFTGPGTFNIDNFRVYRTDTAYLDFSAQEYRELKAAGMQALRTHAFIKTGFRTYDMAQFTNAGGVIGLRLAQGNTLPQVLKIMRKAGVRPWLQVEFHMSPPEWLALVEYMAAPYDPKRDTPASKPWAYKRFAQGQRKPWVEEFDRIYFELGNETWNALFYPWTFDGMQDAATRKAYTPGQVYGLFQEYVIATLKSSPYWRAALNDKFAFVLGGWSGLDYGREAAAVSPSSRYLGYAAYNGGWDEGEGPPRANALGIFNVLSQVYQAAIPTADTQVKQTAALKSGNSRGVSLATYEGGPGYALDGLNGEHVSAEQTREQELVMKSLAAGTATLDSFLARAYRGFELQNFFMFRRGTHWSSHAKWYRGGQAFPAWKTLALFNREATGAVLRTQSLSVPTYDLPAQAHRQAVKDAPLAAVYATRKGGRMSVVVISRKLPGFPVAGDDGFTPVTLELPIARAKSITLFRMSGDPAMNNVTADNVRIEKVDIPAAALNGKFALNAKTGADERGLAPASTFLYVFDGIADAPGQKP